MKFTSPYRLPESATPASARQRVSRATLAAAIVVLAAGCSLLPPSLRKGGEAKPIPEPAQTVAPQAAPPPEAAKAAPPANHAQPHGFSRTGGVPPQSHAP